jgi:4'-phosphopantetheinyl transferase
MNILFSRRCRPSFHHREIHVWTVQLDASDRQTEESLSWLSSKERARALAFRFDHDRRNFILSHGALRTLLGDLQQDHPRGVKFIYGPRGKPTLQNTNASVTFNMAHSGNVAAYAFTVDCPIGIDIERVRPLPDLESLAARFFNPAEVADLLSLSGSDRLNGFFTCWTRKEAYIKAMGDGLAIDLASFRVTLVSDAPPRLVSVDGLSSEEPEWTLHHLTPEPDCIAALAYPDAPRPVSSHPAISAGDLFRIRNWQ